MPDRTVESRVDSEEHSSAQQIRRAATRLFARHGFDGTSLQRIAEEAGMSKPTLLYHYASKEALRSAVLGNLIAHFREAVPQLLQAVTSGQGRFEALLRELVHFFREDPDRARLVMRELMDRPAEMQRLMLDNLRPWVLLVAEYVRKGQQTGEVRPEVDPESYVLHMVTLTIATLGSLPLTSRALSGEVSDARASERHLRELSRLARVSLFTERPESAS
ncbi:MAG: TetR/AcrR family transcriptional regulator [Polyangiaceae bacterium]|nr:TetR/AcrR family transcriptional regulator [Polyangiaceae bacterium]MCW5792584.1 TetR/AcrR family transcriptional regulator [Polyangiaceae bacterium]